MTRHRFASPEDVESAFYEALERGDLPSMMAVWATSEEIICVHPGGPRITGADAVRDSWMQVFQSGSRLRFRVSGAVLFRAPTLAVHSVYEHIRVVGKPTEETVVTATNVYILTEGGWQMLIHHASALPEPPPERPQGKPRTIH